jgi:hypothetical protein
MQRITMCANAGLATVLKADSHPSGIGLGDVSSVGERLLAGCLSVDGCGNRSPLLVRLTIIVSGFALSATLVPAKATMLPATKQLKSAAAPSSLTLNLAGRHMTLPRSIAR